MLFFAVTTVKTEERVSSALSPFRVLQTLLVVSVALTVHFYTLSFSLTRALVAA